MAHWNNCIAVGGSRRTSVRIITKTFPEFASKFKMMFTAGLVLFAVTDVALSAARYYYLRNIKEGYSFEVVDAVVVFTINDGLLTCAVVIATVACGYISQFRNVTMTPVKEGPVVSSRPVSTPSPHINHHDAVFVDRQIEYKSGDLLRNYVDDGSNIHCSGSKKSAEEVP
ncbi:hypothetical protein BT96DRAFT_1025377 [Gymnopus androsaceus JB14]|uniref:Uncharacterized protein n=1 Tax=Gymnopus androsaceus JB14 TaxID=1447944 RepID=A0A6A4GTG7_9AGAR|nr:hypothetical protein BT96DRAFT_1025377 [Gymnopus androsaceus JB14]